ncbi:MAG: type II secretion system minor pseudopilin GspK [Chloroflexi bacterium]|nr:type II secretion system minor pseudopilin GspK [Chloroflexota bacterium]
MIVVIVMIMMSLMMGNIVQLSGESLNNTQYVALLKEREQGYYIARSALGAMPRLLNDDDKKVDSLTDTWAHTIGPIELEEGVVTINIEDEERFFNPQYLLEADGKVEQKHLDQLRRLLTHLEIDPDWSNVLVDWMDEDSDRRYPGGAEGTDYEKVPCKNAGMDSIQELYFLPGIEKEKIEGSESADRRIPGLVELFTLYSNGKVNINTAPYDVLLSLDEELTENLATEIIRRRGDQPFENLSDLQDLPGVTGDLVYRLQSVAGVTSENFKVKIQVKIGESTTYLTAVLERGSTSSKVRFIKVE